MVDYPWVPGENTGIRTASLGHVTRRCCVLWSFLILTVGRPQKDLDLRYAEGSLSYELAKSGYMQLQPRQAWMVILTDNVSDV